MNQGGREFGEGSQAGMLDKAQSAEHVYLTDFSKIVTGKHLEIALV